MIRLTENQLVDLVKKVIKEQKKFLNEGTQKIGGINVTTTNKSTLLIGNNTYSTEIESLVYNGPVVITNIEEVDGEYYGKNYKFTTNKKGQSKTFDKDEIDNAIRTNNGKKSFSIGNSLGKIKLTKIS